MALFKISKGLSTSLPEALTEGYCWYTYNDSKFYIDFKDENGVLSRKALNAKEAEKLTGYDITTILNSSDIEIPTSKAVIDAIEDAKTDALNNDVVVLAEAQRGIDAVSALVGDTPVAEQINEAVSQKSQVQMIAAGTSDIVPVLKIHPLTQDEYDQKLADGTVEENTIYLTPDEAVPVLPTVTTADNGKVLMVINGEWTAVEINLTVDANGVLSV